MSTITDSWQLLTFPKPKQLNEAARQFHHAAQLVAMIGDSLLSKAGDDSQSNLEWLPGYPGLAGQWIKDYVRFGLLYDPVQLIIVQKARGIAGRFTLHQHTLQEGEQWIIAEAKRHHLRLDKLRPIRHFEIPDHPVASGRPFSFDDPLPYQELARYRANADLVLNHFADQFEEASDVRTWPHHFDTGSVLTVTADEEGQANRTIGIGLAIADQEIEEFYFYVNHWSAEGEVNYDPLPDLAAGEWHSGNWTGAILKASEVVKRPTIPEQARLVEDFFRTGINASLQLLGQPERLK